MMKKKIFAFLTATLCMGTISHAKVPGTEISFGGIAPLDTMSYVQQIYGEGEGNPPAYDYRSDVYRAIASYGGTVEFWCDGNSADPDDQKVTMIKITANNGFATPKGIHVGSTRKEVLAAYGMPDSPGYKTNPKNPRNYILYQSKDNPSSRMYFYFKNDIVTEIRAGFNL